MVTQWNWRGGSARGLTTLIRYIGEANALDNWWANGVLHQMQTRTRNVLRVSTFFIGTSGLSIFTNKGRVRFPIAEGFFLLSIHAGIWWLCSVLPNMCQKTDTARIHYHITCRVSQVSLYVDRHWCPLMEYHIITWLAVIYLQVALKYF